VRVHYEQRVTWPLFAVDDARIGVVYAVLREKDSHTPMWLLVQLRGLRRRLRAVPATRVFWRPPGRMVVPYQAETVAASPRATGDSLQDADWYQGVAAFYEHQGAAAS
jgi:hypothetical protein